MSALDNRIFDVFGICFDDKLHLVSISEVLPVKVTEELNKW